MQPEVTAEVVSASHSWGVSESVWCLCIYSVAKLCNLIWNLPLSLTGSVWRRRPSGRSLWTDCWPPNVSEMAPLIFLASFLLPVLRSPVSHTAPFASRRYRDLPGLPQVRVQRREHRILAGVRGLQEDQVLLSDVLQGQDDLQTLHSGRGCERGKRTPPLPITFLLLEFVHM